MEKYELLAKLINYPGSEFLEEAKMARAHLDKAYPAAIELLESYISAIKEISLDKIQESYTTTFDLQQMCSLDVGYVMFGEDYKRGEFLVNVQRLCKEHQVDVKSELPDHLPNMLVLLPRLPEHERKEVAQKILIPALEKMVSTLNQGDANKNFFVLPLQTIEKILNTDFEIKKRRKALYGGPRC